MVVLVQRSGHLYSTDMTFQNSNLSIFIKILSVHFLNFHDFTFKNISYRNLSCIHKDVGTNISSANTIANYRKK